MNYFKVKIGFDNDDYISIDENELEKAIIAQTTGKVALLKEGSISGNSIISILPDYNRMMGWNRDYKLNGEDYEYIGKKKQEDSRMMIENTRNRLLNVGGNLIETNNNGLNKLNKLIGQFDKK